MHNPKILYASQRKKRKQQQVLFVSTIAFIGLMIIVLSFSGCKTSELFYMGYKGAVDGTPLSVSPVKEIRDHLRP